MATIEQKQLKKKAQLRKEKMICDDFMKLRAQYPDEGITCIFETLADRYRKQNLKQSGLAFPNTGMRIKQIIVKHGLYVPRKR
jgi:hypothetical protein